MSVWQLEKSTAQFVPDIVCLQAFHPPEEHLSCLRGGGREAVSIPDVVVFGLHNYSKN